MTDKDPNRQSFNIPNIGPVDRERFIYEIGSCLFRLTPVAMQLGHSAVFGCIKDYIQPTQTMTPEEQAAILIVKDVVRNKTDQMHEKWSLGPLAEA